MSTEMHYMWYILLYILYIWYSVPEQEYVERSRPAERMRLDVRVDRQVQVEGLGAYASVIAPLALSPILPLPVPLSVPFLPSDLCKLHGQTPGVSGAGWVQPSGHREGGEREPVFRPCLLPGLLQLALSHPESPSSTVAGPGYCTSLGFS